jgi:hypothetical protein
MNYLQKFATGALAHGWNVSLLIHTDASITHLYNSDTLESVVRTLEDSGTVKSFILTNAAGRSAIIDNLVSSGVLSVNCTSRLTDTVDLEAICALSTQ